VSPGFEKKRQPGGRAAAVECSSARAKNKGSGLLLELASAQFNRDPEDIPESRRQPTHSGMSGGERASLPPLRRQTPSPADTVEKVDFSSAGCLGSSIGGHSKAARIDFFGGVLRVAVKLPDSHRSAV
jgi:hypothetical protein